MPQLTEQEQRILLALARQALEHKLQQRPAAEDNLNSVPRALLEPAGAFVTLRREGRLRGCIGHVFAEKPLYQVVQDCAVSAALADLRFSPITPEELPALYIEISVLSALTSVAPEQIEVGRHGLFVSKGRRHGLLLPQVAVEWHWDRERFIEETCAKAGLPPDAWRKGAALEAFTAQVFGEPFEPTALGEAQSNPSYSAPHRKSA